MKLALGFLGLCMLSTLHAQTYNTSCTLYPNVAYCTTTTNDGGRAIAAEQQQEQYQAGYAIGRGIGLAIARHRFPGWRRKYCSQHPEQEFRYDMGDGAAIVGTCPTLDRLANEAAAEFHAKHLDAVRSPEHAQAIDKFIADNKLSPWEPKSYETAAKATDPVKADEKKKKSS